MSVIQFVCVIVTRITFTTDCTSVGSLLIHDEGKESLVCM